MKRKTKRLLGSLGILAVGAITIFAAFLPTPTTNATSSVTDTITLRVVEAFPTVLLSGIESGSTVVEHEQNFNVEYTGADTVEITVIYTDRNGDEHTKIIDSLAPDYVAGDSDYTLDLLDMVADDGTQFDYGDYQIVVNAEGYEGANATDIIEFEYVPVVGEYIEEEDGTKHVEIEYEPTPEGEVDHVEIVVKDEDGNPVIGPIEVPKGTTDVEIPFEDYDLPTGDYTIEITAYDEDDNQLDEPYIIIVHYERIAVPDTGTLTKMLNISESDFLATGLIIFGITAFSGLIFVAKRKSNK